MKPKTKPQPAEETPAAGQIAVHCAHARMVDVTELIPNPRNPNKHGDKQVAMLAKIIRHQGWRAPITVSKRSGFIVTGHGRLEAAKLLQVQTVPVDFQDFATEADEWAHLVADNRIAELAEIDSGELSGLLKELEASGMDLDLAGFDTEALMEVEGFDAPDSEVDAEPQEDKAEELRAKWKVETGQLWELGDHRLLCGDSTNKEHVSLVLKGTRADMMFTDPPYGVNYSGGIQFQKDGTATTANRKKLANDDSTEIYPAFLKSALPSIDGPCYMWFADSKARDVYNAVHDCGCEVHALIIWHKTNATYAAMNAQYKQRHEPCLYFKPNGSTLRWCGASTEATVWNQDRDGINEFHPTQKPVALAAKAIRNHDAETVFDAFSGSGSTLMACEQLGRKCRAIEISPAYVAVALQRWADATGKTPKLIDG